MRHFYSKLAIFAFFHVGENNRFLYFRAIWGRINGDSVSIRQKKCVQWDCWGGAVSITACDTASGQSRSVWSFRPIRNVFGSDWTIRRIVKRMSRIKYRHFIWGKDNLRVPLDSIYFSKKIYGPFSYENIRKIGRVFNYWTNLLKNQKMQFIFRRVGQPTQSRKVTGWRINKNVSLLEQDHVD